jgi:hypothetical protein
MVFCAQAFCGVISHRGTIGRNWEKMRQRASGLDRPISGHFGVIRRHYERAAGPSTAPLAIIQREAPLRMTSLIFTNDLHENIGPKNRLAWQDAGWSGGLGGQVGLGLGGVGFDGVLDVLPELVGRLLFEREKLASGLSDGFEVGKQGPAKLTVFQMRMAGDALPGGNQIG